MPRQQQPNAEQRVAINDAGQANHTGQEGFALVFAVLMTLVVAGLGTALILDATTEARSSSNFRTSAQAFYVARSGLEEARARVPFFSPTAITLPTAVNSVVYIR